MKKGGQSNPLRDTLQTVPGMPSKLKIFRVDASPYWWVRLFLNGRYRIRTLKTKSLTEARNRAKKFFTDENIQDSKDFGVHLAVRSISTRDPKSFAYVGYEFIESLNIPSQKRRYLDNKQRFEKELLPFFSKKRIDEVSSADIGVLIRTLLASGRSASTVVQYVGVLRRVLKFAADNKHIQSIPNVPKIPGRAVVSARDYFPIPEYKQLVRTASLLAEKGVAVKGKTVTIEFKYLIQFMVNSFIRPSDLRKLKHKHVHTRQKNAIGISRGDRKYLELHHPETKTTNREVVTMPAAHGVYVKLKTVQEKNGYGKPDDYVFFPEYQNRNTMMYMVGKMFREVLNQSGIDQSSGKHTVYSLRHTSIMYRLIFGNTDSLTLAKNARTSQLMIEKYYSSRLSPSLVVDSIHSFKP